MRVNSVGDIYELNNGYRKTSINNNNKTKKRCINCCNCNNMYCLLKKRKVTSDLEATRCEKFKKIEFAMFLKKLTF